MMIVLSAWLTRENVLAVISVCAFILSLGTWVRTWLESRQRLSVYLEGYSFHVSVSVLKISFINESRLPVTIYRIEHVIGKDVIACVRLPKTIYEHTRRNGSTVLEHEIRKSMPVPIHLEALGYADGYLLFEVGRPASSELPTQVKLQLYTNRRRSTEFVFHMSPVAIADIM